MKNAAMIRSAVLALAGLSGPAGSRKKLIAVCGAVALIYPAVYGFEAAWQRYHLWPNSAAFGPAKFAVRGLAQVLSRDLHPQGIHVAYVNVDGAIDMPLIRQFLPQLKDEDLLKPSAIADAFWFLAHQDPSAWSHELDVRPFKEKF